MVSKIDKYKGCLIALAVGDALGSPIQFKARDTYPHIERYITGGKYNSLKGEYTDDTSMALCLAESLIKSKGFDASNQLELYAKWLRYGYMSTRDKAYDIGLTTKKSIRYYMSSGINTTYLDKEEDSGNGSLMRLAPVVMYYAMDIDKAVLYAGKSSLTTHASPIVIDACRYFAYVLTLIFNGVSKTELFNSNGTDKMQNYFKDKPLHPEVMKIANGSYFRKSRKEILSSGYVIHTLEAALWAFYNEKTFKDTILSAVNLGDDADTVGAVAGQVAGAYYGIGQIDEIFLTELFNKALIIEFAEKLYIQRDSKG